MITEKRLREQSAHYLPCFISQCSRHETCLHWLTGQETTELGVNIFCVNPMNPDVKAGQCPLYRENKTVLYARGMMHFFEEMPGHMEQAIKRHLISLYTRKRFYEYRNGTRLIPPEAQQQIARICQEKGWTGPLRYDGWEEDYLW